MSLHLSSLYYRGEAHLNIFPPGATLPIGADGNVDFVNGIGMTSFPDGVIGIPSVLENTYTFDLTAFYEGFSQHRVRLNSGLKYNRMNTWEKKNFGPGVLDGSQAVKDGALIDVSGTTDIYIQDQSRTILFASVQDEWALMKHWQLTAGARIDHYSDFGDTVNPRLALVWETRYDLTSKAMYGRAFRPPNYAESYVTNNPLTLGNKNLEPETIDTYELAFDYQPTKDLRTKLNLFAYDIDGLIESVLDPGQTTKTAQNAKDQQGHGLEVETTWDATDTLRITSNFAWQRSKDKTTKEVTPNTPALQFYANAHWEFLADWSVDCQYYLIADRHRANGDTRADIKDNEQVNLTLRRKDISDHWDAALSVRNLFDEHLLEPTTTAIPNDYPMESRAIWAELLWHF